MEWMEKLLMGEKFVVLWRNMADLPINMILDVIMIEDVIEDMAEEEEVRVMEETEIDTMIEEDLQEGIIPHEGEEVVRGQIQWIEDQDHDRSHDHAAGVFQDRLVFIKEVFQNHFLDRDPDPDHDLFAKIPDHLGQANQEANLEVLASRDVT